MDDPNRSKRIAKNSLLLYVRTLFVLIINLYTSRVLLKTLGVMDYGIYNVVGGVIVMLGYLTYSLSSASSRYITYDLGIGDIKLMRKTFGNILSIHFIMIWVIIVLAETIGLWFVTTQLYIPHERYDAAFWVYQYAMLSSIVSVIRTPYNAAIIAHEKMSVFAYLSIIDAILKLVIVYILLIVPYDRLIIYSFLFLCLQLLEFLVYIIYCVRNIEETKSCMSYDKNVFRKIFTFAGWTLGSNIAAMGATQGLNMLLNLFWGPMVNAARGIAVQVQYACNQFCSNFQMALNPQLTKSYAQGDLTYMHKLLIVSSKYSFFILFIIVLPIILGTSFVLKFWLGTPPDYAISFVRLMLISALLFTLSNPIIVSAHATGTIKRFQLVEGGLLLMIVPISYTLLKIFHLSPNSVFVVQIIMELVVLCARLYIVLPMINMPFDIYIQSVVKPLIKVLILTIIPLIIIYNWGLHSITLSFASCILGIMLSIFNIYRIGCSNSERRFLKNKIINLKYKLYNKFHL